MPAIVSEYYCEVLEKKKNISTANNYLSDICRFFRYFRERNSRFYISMTSDEIREYIDKLQCGSAGKASAWTALNSFFTYLEDKGYIHKNPMRKVTRAMYKEDSNERNLSCTEVLNVINTVGLSRKSRKKRDLAIVLLVATCGLKVGTIHEMNMDNYIYSTGVLSLGEKEIKLPLQTQKALEEWLNKRNADSQNADKTAMFISDKHKRISSDSIERITTAYDLTIEKNFSFEDVRKAIAGGLLNIGVSLEYISNYMQHSNPSSTYSFLEKFHGKEKESKAEDEAALLKIFGYSSVDEFKTGNTESFAFDLLEESGYASGTTLSVKPDGEDEIDPFENAWFNKDKVNLYCKAQTVSHSIIWIPFDSHEKSGFYLSPLVFYPEYDCNEIEDRHIFFSFFDPKEYVKSDWQDENSVEGDTIFFFLYATGKRYGETVSFLRIYAKDAGINNTIHIFESALCSGKQADIFLEKIENNIQFFEELASNFEFENMNEEIAYKLHNFATTKLAFYDFLCSFRGVTKDEESLERAHRVYGKLQTTTMLFILDNRTSELKSFLDSLPGEE